MSIAKLKTKFSTGVWLPDFKSLFNKTNEIVDYINDNPSSSLPYKVYTAILSQSSGDDPIVRVLNNTLLGTLEWTRVNTGNYILTSSLTEFTEDKTHVLITVDNSAFIQAYWSNANTIAVDTQNISGVAADGKMIDTSIEIKVYD